MYALKFSLVITMHPSMGGRVDGGTVKWFAFEFMEFM